MRRELLSRAVGGIDDRFIAEAYRPIAAGASERSKHMRKRKLIALALAAALVLGLGTVAYALYERRLQDLVLRSDSSETVIVEESETADPAAVDALAEVPDMLSLQGYAESPEYQAARDWTNFVLGYDPGGKILASVGNGPTPWADTYGANGYYVYSQEMADTLEDIASRYGLQLHSGGMHSVSSMEELYQRVGRFSSTTEHAGYYYDDGTFQCDCAAEGYEYQLRRCMKGTMDGVGLMIGDAELYEQWEYETACGVTVLLAIGPNKALIIADLPQSFVTVNVLAALEPIPGEERFDRERLQALADSLDLSIL